MSARLASNDWVSWAAWDWRATPTFTSLPCERGGEGVDADCGDGELELLLFSRRGRRSEGDSEVATEASVSLPVPVDTSSAALRFLQGDSESVPIAGGGAPRIRMLSVVWIHVSVSDTATSILSDARPQASERCSGGDFNHWQKERIRNLALFVILAGITSVGDVVAVATSCAQSVGAATRVLVA